MKPITKSLELADKHGGKMAFGTVVMAIGSIVALLGYFDLNISDLTRISSTVKTVSQQAVTIDSLEHVVENHRKKLKAQRHQSFKLIEILSREDMNILTMSDLFSLQTPDSLRSQ